MINGYYRDLFEREGLDVVELLSADEYQAFLAT